MEDLARPGFERKGPVSQVDRGGVGREIGAGAQSLEIGGERALSIIEEGAGPEFDKDIAHAFIDMMRRWEGRVAELSIEEPEVLHETEATSGNGSGGGEAPVGGAPGAGGAASSPESGTPDAGG